MSPSYIGRKPLGGDRRVGVRADQKRRWDRANYVPSTAARDRKELNWNRVAAMWADGMLGREIAAEMGWSLNRLAAEKGRMRAAGWDLPKRPKGRRPQ